MVQMTSMYSPYTDEFLGAGSSRDDNYRRLDANRRLERDEQREQWQDEAAWGIQSSVSPKPACQEDADTRLGPMDEVKPEGLIEEETYRGCRGYKGSRGCSGTHGKAIANYRSICTAQVGTWGG